MKVLIIDDEEHVREGIEIAVDWSHYHMTDILMAEDGMEALEIVQREVPDLIICDMSMPRMDGVTFLEKLRQEGWNSKVIVLSGYQEFRYTRATLLANGVDYLLKPFKIDDLNRAISKAVTSIDENKQRMNEELRRNYKYNEANMLINEQKMAAYLQGERPNHQGVHQLLEQVEFPTSDFYMMLFLPRNTAYIVDRYYKGDEALFIFSVINILEDIFRPINHHYFFRIEAFFCVMAAGNVSKKEIESYYDKLEKAWRMTIRLESFPCFLGKTYSSMNLLAGIQEAKAEIVQVDLLGGLRRAEVSRRLPTFVDREIVVMEALKNRDKEYVGGLISSFTRELRKQRSLTLKELQHCTLEVNLLIMRISSQLKEGHLVQMMPLWISDLEEWEKGLTHIFWHFIELEGESLSTLQGIQAVHHYIASHWNEDITLTTLSDRFHFSPQYLSKKFKETYNTTIMSYLTHLRMENAKSLLIHSDINVLEVSQNIGYEDDNYFGKVFRKHFGVSPTQYRRNHRSSHKE